MGPLRRAFEPYSEITITRRLFRSGESEYLINKVPCRLRDITDLFLDSGLGVDGYSIVEQGRVEYLIKANPQDRRFLIEEAAGIAKYKERKRLALMKMEATQQNLLRIQDIIAEVKRQIVSLERQVKRAEEYKTIRKEIKEIELRLALQEYEELSEKGEAARGYLQALQERETGISSQSAQKEALIEEMRLHGMEEEEKLRSLQQEVFELGRKIQKLESEMEFLRREDENLQKQEGQALFEVRENLGAWRQANRDRRKLVQGRESLEEEYRLNGEKLKALESHFNDVKVDYQSFLETSEEEKGKLIDTLTHLTSLRNRLSHLDERREDLQKRIRSNQEEAKKASSKEAELGESLRTSTRERETLLSVRSVLQEEKVRWEGELDALKEVFKQKQAERREKEDALRQDRSRYLSLKELQENFEGYEKGVKSILLQKKETAEKWNGILGTVADILEPEPQYEVPLEAVLGQRLQYLIAENNKDAMEAIDYLKRGSLGRGSFLPREVPRKEEGCPCHEAPSLEFKEGGNPLPLMGFVNVKEGYGPLAEFLIGDVGVVQRREEAIQRIPGNGHFNVLVTLDGDVIERTGIVSGGSLDQGLSLLERRRVIRQLEGMIKEREETCRILHGEEQGRTEEIEEREARLEKRKQEIQDKELELVHKERDLEHLAKDMDQCKREMEVLHFEKSQLEEETRELEREKEEVSLKMGAGEATKQQGEEQVQSLKKRVEDLREESDRLGAEITERKVFLASLEEKQRGMETQRLTLSNSQKTLKEQILRRMKRFERGERRGPLLPHETISRRRSWKRAWSIIDGTRRA